MPKLLLSQVSSFIALVMLAGLIKGMGKKSGSTIQEGQYCNLNAEKSAEIVIHMQTPNQ
jgi:hypothetical protein